MGYVAGMDRLLLASLTLLLAAVPAQAVFEEHSRTGNLDGDRARETARTENVTQRGFDRTALRIADPCPSGEPYSRRVTGVEDSLARLQLRRADTHPGREVFVDLRSGAAGRAGEARVVAWRHPEGEVCGVPRKLFHFDSEHPGRRPERGSYLANFGVVVRNASAAHPGLEVVVDQFWARSGEGACCPTIHRRMWHRYSESRDRYVVYKFRTTLRQPPPEL